MMCATSCVDQWGPTTAAVRNNGHATGGGNRDDLRELRRACSRQQQVPCVSQVTMRVELIGHFKPCMTDSYLHIDARRADYIRTHPYYRQNSKQNTPAIVGGR